MARMQELYEKKGYPKEWIDKRLRGIAVRQDLTDEWKNRGARSSLELAILTNEIMPGAFDLKVEEYKQVKGLQRENLRDHMTGLNTPNYFAKCFRKQFGCSPPEYKINLAQQVS